MLNQTDCELLDTRTEMTVKLATGVGEVCYAMIFDKNENIQLL